MIDFINRFFSTLPETKENYDTHNIPKQHIAEISDLKSNLGASEFLISNVEDIRIPLEFVNPLSREENKTKSRKIPGRPSTGTPYPKFVEQRSFFPKQEDLCLLKEGDESISMSDIISSRKKSCQSCKFI